MWTVRNNLKGALKFTDIFIGGKPIVLKSKGFLDLDLIDGGRAAAEMSEQLKRCYDEAYVRDIHRTNTPDEVVQMNLRDLENIAQRTEIEDLKSKLKDGGSKMDQILAAINKKSDLPNDNTDLIALKDELQGVIDQIQNVAPEPPPNTTEQSDQEQSKPLSQADYNKSLEDSNQQLRELLKAQDQKIDALGQMLQNQRPNSQNNSNGVEKALDQQAQKLEQLMSSIHQQKELPDDEDETKLVKVQESEFDFNEPIQTFENPLPQKLEEQIEEIKQIKSLIKNQQETTQSSTNDPVHSQLEEQKQQINQLMDLLKAKENPVQQHFGISAEEQRQVLKNQLLQQKQMDQITELIQQKVDQIQPQANQPTQIEQQLQEQQDQIKKLTELLQNQNTQTSQPSGELSSQLSEQQSQLQNLTHILETQNQKDQAQTTPEDSKLEQQLQQQQDQIQQLTALLQNQQNDNGDADHELAQQMSQQQAQLQNLTQLLETQKREEPNLSNDEDRELMQKNLQLQHEQLMNISKTMQELKEKDDARHEDIVDLKVLMAQHQNGNTFSRVVKTLSQTDIEAALKVSDQIDDKITDKSFEVTKKTKQKVDHPDVSELLGDTDLDFD